MDAPPPETDADSFTDNKRNKGNKRKRAGTEQKNQEPDAALSATTDLQLPSIGTALNLSSDDAEIIDRLRTSYDIQLHSIISSSKIQKKVTSVLRHLRAPSGCVDREATEHYAARRKCISVLRARAADAGKLISISEITKRELSRPSPNDNGPQSSENLWFQYIALGEEVSERSRRPHNPRNRLLEGKTIIHDTMLERSERLEKRPKDEGGPAVEGREGEINLHGTGDDNNGKDDSDDFEIMKTRFERAIDGQPLTRGVPFMCLFLCRDSVDELKRRYGEQTNNNSKH